VEITDFVGQGSNTLEVRVTNLWPNRLIRDAQLPESERLTHITFPFFGPEDSLRDGGLIGPVFLIKKLPSVDGTDGSEGMREIILNLSKDV
jgi:hypothetical protein